MPAFDLARFHHVLHTAVFGHELIFEVTTGSTMDLARDAARGGAPEGTVALADEQTAGRGRMGRSWVTPPAVNLASTVVLRPDVPILRHVAMIVPLAIVLAVDEVANVRCDIKWPNDVQVAGKKLAGVLIETEFSDDGSPSFVLVGAGINVNFDPREHDEIRDIATSLRAELGHDTERETLLAHYLARFEALYRASQAATSPRDAWRERLVTLGQAVRVSWQGGAVEGVAEDVDEHGALLVRAGDGSLVTVEAGDVTLRT